MKTTNYAGIDYSRGLANCDASSGIRYGVISQHSVSPYAIDDIMTQGEDLAWKEAFDEAKREAAKEYAEKCGCDIEDAEIDEDAISDELGTRWESSLSNYLYEADGYKVTGCGDSDLFVLKSPFFTYCQLCSPCVPGAGNLDSPFESSVNQEGLNGEDYAKEAEENGFPRVYCLGHEWFESGIAPYGVYSVATGKAVFNK